MSTIVAISTPQGVGGIAVIRVSGPDAKTVIRKFWKGKDVNSMVTHTAHLGRILQSNGEELDEVVLTTFWAPNSFTGEDVVEISCHGSKWIQREIVNTLVEAGARPAGPGEFTQRAFMNGRIDLARAEGVADLIAASSAAAHRLAVKQANGTFSSYLESLRHKLIDFASMLELELDFSEEDVEFADREKLINLCAQIKSELRKLERSYKSGRVIKEGVPVVIAGEPNAGKSTLLNYLLGEEKAIVTNIPGTTRDIIEDTIELDGILFRFIDTAGLRNTTDEVEQIGITRAERRMGEADIILWMIDTSSPTVEEAEKEIDKRIASNPGAAHVKLYSKSDLIGEKGNAGKRQEEATKLVISAKTGEGLEELERKLVELAKARHSVDEEIVLTNARHYYEIASALDSLNRVEEGLTNGLSGDFIAQDLRATLAHLGTITGTITTPDILSSIFQNFCIGK